MKKRIYKQNCALALASDLIGERWTLLIIRGLLVRPMRYGELLSDLPGMGTNLLATRLKELERDGIICKQNASKTAPYCLSSVGETLEPVVLAMVRWSMTSFPQRQEADYFHNPDWDLVALKSLYQPLKAPVESITVQFDHPTWKAWVTVDQRAYTCGLGMSTEKTNLVWEGLIGSLQQFRENVTELTKKENQILEIFMATFIVPD
ncbi:MAG: helix-turn-helix transcriptional regulator [Pseudomonadales bacterium]|nr:helix-turn-helix transcriptional regulator [Pseudomonadales bacterium]